MEKKRLEYVDIARGIAMICIILGHLNNDSINSVVYTFHVPIFFLIAGFFISDKLSCAAFIKKRAKNLLIPYALTGAVLIIIGTIEGFLTGLNIYGFQQWAWAVIYGAGNSFSLIYYVREVGAIWFLWAMFWASIFLRLSLKMNKWVRIVFIAALFAAAVISKNYIWLPFSLQPGMCGVLFMYIGWLVKQNMDTIRKLSKEACISALIVSAAVWAFFIKDFTTFWFVRCDFGRGAVDVLSCLCACLCVIAISKGIELKIHFLGKRLALIGRYSLLILCIHNIELNMVPWRRMAEYLVGLGMPSWMQLPLIIICKMTADLFFTWLFLKIPFIRRVFGYENKPVKAC